ncbi:MAG: hypothetical protein U0939_20785 [Pirellulales bacterium]
MRVRVELFGIPRQRAGCDQIALDCPARDGECTTLGQLLEQLAYYAPALAQGCFVRDARGAWRLSPHTIAQVGCVFTRDPNAPLEEPRDGESSVLLLSADAGG